MRGPADPTARAAGLSRLARGDALHVPGKQRFISLRVDFLMRIGKILFFPERYGMLIQTLLNGASENLTGQ